MARPLRIVYPGAIYHVTTRGNERKELYLDDEDCEVMRQKLAASLERFQVRLYAYVFMRNHFHLLVETPQANLSRFMQHFNTAYTVYFNRRHQRHGHLLEGRFTARLVENSQYVLRLTRYIHLNPVNVKSVHRLSLEQRIALLRQFRWSSYGGYTNISGKENFLDYAPLLAWLGAGKKDHAKAYQEFVEGGIAQSDEELAEMLARSSKAIGGESFCRWAEAEQQKSLSHFKAPEEIRMRKREVVGVDPELILATVSQACGVEQQELLKLNSRHPGRRLAIMLLVKEGRLSGREVARQMGLASSAAVSRHLRAMAAELSRNATLIRLVEKATGRLQSRLGAK